MPLPIAFSLPFNVFPSFSANSAFDTELAVVEMTISHSAVGIKLREREDLLALPTLLIHA
jgi:hypothetical protein